MCRILLLICVFTVACTNPNNNISEPNNVPASDSVKSTETLSASNPLITDSAIAFIRNAYQQINGKLLKNRVFKWEAEGCNSDGTATYYLSDKNEIVKVVETGAIGDGSWTTSYYYQNGQFIFSLQTDVGGPAVGPVDTFTVRKYAYSNKVIRVKEKDVYTTPVDSILTPASKEYKILEAYKNENFGAAFCQ